MPELRRPSLVLLFGLLLARSAVAGGEPPAWPEIGDAAAGWDVLGAAPEDPASDPDLGRWGVRSRHVRFYTRLREDGVESCGVEIWYFVDRAHASAAERGFAYPDWQIARVGDALVMLHGRRPAGSAPPERGVGPACARIGRAVERRLPPD